ncbi:MAG: 6-bladed beta-propeller [Prevotellaceae bacterium]|jgi:hypothetical protein|nr:6-bladed beta-propeller [Prevotellaceae bacterium]
MKYFLSSLLLAACFQACSPSHEAIRTLAVPIETISDYVPLSTIAEVAYCIPLETRDSVQVDSIHKIVAQGDKYYVADEDVLHCFDAVGRHLYMLDKRGDRPGEYTVLSDFDVDAAGNIWVLAPRNRALYKYAPDGTYMEGIALDFDAMKIKLMDERRMAVYQGALMEEEGKTLHIYDLQTKQRTASYMPADPYQSQYLHVFTKNHFSRSYAERDGWNFFRLFNDTVYRLTNEGVIPQYVVKTGDENIPAEFYHSRYENVLSFFERLYETTYAYGTDLFIENSAGYYYHFLYDRHNLLAFLPKEEGATPIVTRGIRENISLSGFPIDFDDEYVQVFLQTDNSLIIPLPADRLYAFTGGEQFAGENLNPVLLHIELKKNK